MMKAQLIGKKIRGMATLEILIAFAILSLSMGAVILVAFGNQSVAVDSQLSMEALGKAQKMLEEARATSRQDFNLVNPYTNTETSGPLTFTKTLDVQTSATDPTLDVYTKKVTSLFNKSTSTEYWHL
jgi:type II secretory pathway pseudopilin PulG